MFLQRAGHTQQDIQHFLSLDSSSAALLCKARGTSFLLRFHQLPKEVHAATSQMTWALQSQRRDQVHLHQLCSCSATAAGCVLEVALREMTWTLPSHCPAEPQRHTAGRKQRYPCPGTLQPKTLVLQGAGVGEVLYNTQE